MNQFQFNKLRKSDKSKFYHSLSYPSNLKVIVLLIFHINLKPKILI